MTTKSTGQVTLTREEWIAEGTRLFGDDWLTWKFVCPVCGHVAAANDFREYRDKGTTPNSAYQSCIGRFITGSPAAFGTPCVKPGHGPCNYAAFGLLRLAPFVVEGVQVFGFAESD